MPGLGNPIRLLIASPMGALSAVGEGVRPYTASQAIPGWAPLLLPRNLCLAGFPGRLNVTALLGSLPAASPAQPPPWESRPRAWARPDRSSASQTTHNPRHPIQGPRDKGCLIMPTTWRYINWCNDALSSSQIVIPGVATFEHHERLIYFVAKVLQRSNTVATLYTLSQGISRRSVKT